MFTKMAHEAFMKLKQVRRRSWGGGYHIYIYTDLELFSTGSLGKTGWPKPCTPNFRAQGFVRRASTFENLLYGLLLLSVSRGTPHPI